MGAIQQLLAAAGGADATDPYFSSVGLLLNFRSSFVDASASPKTVTQVGTPTVTSDGYTNSTSGNGLSLAAHADFNFGSGDYTVDGFGKATATTSLQVLFGARVGSNIGPTVFIQSGQIRAFGRDSGGTIFADTGLVGSISAGASFHWAWVRSGSNFYLFVNGSSVAGAVSSATAMGNAGSVDLYRDSGVASREWIGSSKALRVTKGVARWTSAFTPPAWPLPEA